MITCLIYIFLWFQPLQSSAGVELFAANISSNEISVYDGESGTFNRIFVKAGSGGLTGATGLTFGPDGDLYVSSSLSNKILRYNGNTGEFKDAFIDDPELKNPFSLIFGPDKHLYISSGRGNVVRRYNGQTGEFMNIAASHASLRQPIGLTFDSDFMLYVVNSVGKNIMRFDPETGRGTVFSTDSLSFPADLTFGRDGKLYVSNAGNGTIVRFDGATGTFDTIYARLPKGAAPVGLAFTSDGRLFAAGYASNRLYLISENGSKIELVETEGLAGPENIVIRKKLSDKEILGPPQESKISETPDWLLKEWELLTSGSGTWIADNTAYQSDQEPFDAYGLSWKWGIGEKSITGELFVMQNGENKGIVWQYRQFWDPEKQKAMVLQFGSDGTYGHGEMERLENGEIRLLQTFFSTSGATWQSGHKSLTDEHRHKTTSYSIENPKWIENRTYNWIKREE